MALAGMRYLCLAAIVAVDQAG